MKKILALTLAALLALSIVGCSKDDEDDSGNDDAVVEDVLTYGDFEYAVNSDGDFEITDYIYTGAESVDVEIPSQIDGRPVTGIAGDAFKAVTAMKSVTIPDSIEYIGQFAFYGCTSLTSVMLPDYITSIGTGAFWGCSSLTSITLPSALRTIGDYAFWNCEKLSNVTLPEALETVGEAAFWGCEAFTEVSVPASVKNVGRSAFAYCTSLTKATFLNNNVEIGKGAFIYGSDAIVVYGKSNDCNAKKFADDEKLNFSLIDTVTP